MGYRKKTSVARGGLQGSITRQPSSRAADEDATVCLSCQHWGELGICQLYIPSLIQARRPRQSPAQTAAHPSLHPHSLPCTLGEQVAAYGDFSTGAFDHSEPSGAELIFISAASSAVLGCAPDVLQWQQSQKGTLRSRSKAGVTETPFSRVEIREIFHKVSVFSSHMSVFFQISASLRSLFTRLLWAEGAIKSQLVKTPPFYRFYGEISNVERQTMRSLAFMQKVNKLFRLLCRVIWKHTGNETSHFPAALSCHGLYPAVLMLCT